MLLVNYNRILDTKAFTAQNTVKQGCYLIALMDVVVDQLKQKPHNIPQDEGGDQVPVDDVSETPYAPIP